MSDAEYEKFFEDAKHSIAQEEEQKQSHLPPQRQLSEIEKRALERVDEFIQMASDFNGFKQYKDDKRAIDAGYYGGFDLKDSELTSRLRSAGKEILKSVGKKILSGKFNLTTISFPIKCMCPLTLL